MAPCRDIQGMSNLCGRHGKHWRDHVSHLTKEELRIPIGGLEDVGGEKDVLATLLKQIWVAMPAG